MTETQPSVREKLRKLYEKGLVHIMGATFLNKVFAFVGNVFVVRILTKTEYGIFGYTDNFLALFISLNGLGMAQAMMQYCSEKRSTEERKKYTRYAFLFGVGFNLIVFVMVLLCAMFAPLKISAARPYLMLFSFYPVLYYVDTFYCMLTRCRRDNREYAKIVNINAFLYMVGEIVGAYCIEAYGVILAIYIAELGASFVGMRYEKVSVVLDAGQLTRSQKKSMIKYAGFSCVNTLISNLLVIMDIFLIGYIIADPVSVASYKVGATIPNVMIVFPTSMMMFVYPYFAEHNTDKEWFIKNAKKLFLYTGIVNLILSALLFICAPLIIKILWGQKYMSSLTVFRILSINYFISATFRVNASSLLATLRKVNLNFYINLIAGTSNIILVAVMIKSFGLIGAPIATCMVVVITTLMLLPILLRSMNDIGKECIE